MPERSREKWTVRLDEGKRVAIEGELLQLHGRDISLLLKNIFSNIKYARHNPSPMEPHSTKRMMDLSLPSDDNIF